MTGYYKQKLIEGLVYQDYVVERLYDCGIPLINYSSKAYQNIIGENKAGIEIKNDQMFRGTGNFWIETAERSDVIYDYVPGGVFRNDNTWLYVIGDYYTIFVFAKKQLKILTKKYKRFENKKRTSIGYLLPVKDAKEWVAIKVIECEPSEQEIKMIKIPKKV